MILQGFGNHLGFFICPGALCMSWDRPQQKVIQTTMIWSSLKLGVFYNARVYQAFLLPILSFVMQLEDAPSNLEEVFSKVLRLMAPGPGNWATPADLVHLKSSYFFPAAFMDPRWEALACKARVIQSVAPDCHAKAKELEALQVNNFRRPFGTRTLISRCWREQQICYHSDIFGALLSPPRWWQANPSSKWRAP